MAYVAKSEKTWNIIKQNINKLFETREEHADSWGSYINEKEFAAMCYSVIIPPSAEALIKQLPEGIVPTTEKFTFKFSITKPAVWGFPDDCKPENFATLDEFNEAYNIREKVMLQDETIIRTVFYANLDPPRYIPDHWTSYHDDAHKLDDKRCTDEIAAIVIKRHTQILAVQNDRDDMLNNAKKIYQSVKSLNQFVKLWEPALSLLDQDIIDRLRKKTVRNASAEDLGIGDADIAELNALFVKAKVSQ